MVGRGQVVMDLLQLVQPQPETTVCQQMYQLSTATSQLAIPYLLLMGDK